MDLLLFLVTIFTVDTTTTDSTTSTASPQIKCLCGSVPSEPLQ